MENKNEYEYTFRALGTECALAVICTSRLLAEEVYQLVTTEVKAYEERFSRFLPTSELSILNRKKNMTVSSIFMDVTEKAHELFVLSGGVFNPLVQIARLGYNKTFAEIKDTIPANPHRPYNIDFNTTTIDRQTSRIHLQKGQKLDYGGFLKGYLAESIAHKIISKFPLVKGCVVNLGGDICARGFDKEDAPFLFSIENPLKPETPIEISLINQSLATSGIYKRHWSHNGHTTHHILDVTGIKNPTETDIISSSVIHSSGALSEVYAKMFLSIPEKSALAYMNPIPTQYILIRSNGQIIKRTI